MDENDILSDLIVEMGLADPETRDRLVAHARDTGKSLVDVLVENRYITRDQHKQILTESGVHKRKPPTTQTLVLDKEKALAMLIVKKGLVDPSTRDILVAQAEETGQPLIDILVLNGFLTPQQKAEILTATGVRHDAAKKYDSNSALQRLIVEMGLVDEKTRDQLVAQATLFEKPLVDLLVEKGHLTRGQRDQILKASGVRRRPQG